LHVTNRIRRFDSDLVDVTGLEPVTPCLQSTRLASNDSTGNLNY
jgi:hypothetical protein